MWRAPTGRVCRKCVREDHKERDMEVADIETTLTNTSPGAWTGMRNCI